MCKTHDCLNRKRDFDLRKFQTVGLWCVSKLVTLQALCYTFVRENARSCGLAGIR